MDYRLSNQVKVGQKIKTSNGWRRITSLTNEGVYVREGFVKFGDTIYGWKLK